ncbi:glycosyltransferase family 4 protein [Rhizorhabdus dicambivorans]|uniref:glycosyltransferase family 4 protein n=1 Tax=Rhizorhabdus dicambivorans TaxID=1850238 RepID=UPI0020D15C67|nr:glycosyltransferase family 4 protein [Rhizorhabdus dicambivorans]
MNSNGSATARTGPILLVTNMMPPLIGGTPMVYDRLARHAAPCLHVLSAWRDPDEARPIPGWRESDSGKPYPISRIAWLRPPIAEPLRRRIGLLDLLLVDIPVMLFVFCAVALKAIRTGARTIVLGELQGLGWLGILLSLLTPWRIVIYTHGEEVVQTAYNRLARLRGPALRASDLILTVSGFTRDRMISDFGVAPERIRLVPNGVDLDRFTPGDQSPGEPFILGVGRLIERKGFDRLIEAFAAIAADFPDVRLRIAGTGAQEDSLRAIAVRLGVADRVDLLGGVSDADLLDLYRRCTFFAMPNRTLADGDTEGFGLIFLEANACGKAVVGGRAGGAVDAIIDGETGLLVDGADGSSVAQALRRLLSDDALRDRLARGGLAHARRLGWDHTAKLFLGAVGG